MSRRIKVVVVGGGSYQWAPTLITDILMTPSLADAHLVLEDIDPAPLPDMEAYARRTALQFEASPVVESTTDLRAALDGADFVVVTISTGGFDSMRHDLEVPARYGIRQSVGDTVGPGGICRALRNIPVVVELARHMSELCPDAWLLNITNPMTCITRAVCRETSTPTVGLCHEVFHFRVEVARLLGCPVTEIDIVMAGVNHLPFITELRVGGEPVGFDILRDPRFVERNAVKLAVLERFGALPGAGDRHVVEFFPWFLTEESGWGKAWGVELTSIQDREGWLVGFRDHFAHLVAGTRPVPTWPSGEMVAPVIDSLITGERRELPLNLPNSGQVAGLPADVVVESMCVVDATGMRGRETVELPPVPREWVRRHVSVQELTVEAALTGDRDLVLAAVAADPLAGRGDLGQIEGMIDELLAATAQWLPQFAA